MKFPLNNKRFVLAPKSLARGFIPHQSGAGFTLVEILVVVCIFSILVGAVGNSFICGMKLWRRFYDTGTDIDTKISFEMIAKELRQSVDMPIIGFHGTVSEVSFPTLDGNSILKVTYKFDADNKTLVRKAVFLKDIISGKEKEKTYIEKNIFSPEEFSLSYLSYDSAGKSYSWKETWEKEKGIVRAVRIKAKFKNEEFVKTVFIPIA